MALYTYIGRRPEGKGLVHTFIKDAQDGSEPKEVYWPKAPSSRFSGCSIGEVYDLPDETPPALWSDHIVGGSGTDEAYKWQVADRAAELKKREKSRDRAPELTMLVERLARARRELSAPQRPLFDAWLLDQIRKGSIS